MKSPLSARLIAAAALASESRLRKARSRTFARRMSRVARGR